MLREINLRAWQTNRRRAEQLASVTRGLGNGSALSPEQCEVAKSLAHQLLGSAGTFGHHEVSVTAARIELLLREVPHLGSAGFTELEALIGSVRDALEHAPPDVP